MTRDEKIAWMAFCHADPKLWMGRPVSDGTWLYATDGHVAVRVPTTEPACDDAKRMSGPSWPDRPAQVEPWPDGPFASGRVECPDCKGEFCGEQCHTCDGSGFTECSECGQDVDCKECHGDGFLGKCQRCEGSGKIDDPKAVLVLEPVSRVGVRGDLAAKIALLPGVVWSPAVHLPQRDKPVPFWFDGGQGLVIAFRYGE